MPKSSGFFISYLQHPPKQLGPDSSAPESGFHVKIFYHSHRVIRRSAKLTGSLVQSVEKEHVADQLTGRHVLSHITAVKMCSISKNFKNDFDSVLTENKLCLSPREGRDKDLLWCRSGVVATGFPNQFFHPVSGCCYFEAQECLQICICRCRKPKNWDMFSFHTRVSRKAIASCDQMFV